MKRKETTLTTASLCRVIFAQHEQQESVSGQSRHSTIFSRQREVSLW